MDNLSQIDGIEILIVDNPYDAELTIRELRNEKNINQIYTAADGEEALDLIFCRRKFSDRHPQQTIKVILLEPKLPLISGLEVLRVIKNNEKTRNLPVVILVSSHEDPVIQTAYNLGVKAYLVKPVQLGEFRKAMCDSGLSWLLM